MLMATQHCEYTYATSKGFKWKFCHMYFTTIKKKSTLELYWEPQHCSCD